MSVEHEDVLREISGGVPDTLANELRMAIMRINRRLRLEASSEALSPGQYSVLAGLQRGPRTLRALADRERVQAPSMTRIVNGLCSQGLVERRDDPDDGRQILVTLTDEGLRRLEEARGQRNEWLSVRLAELTDRQRDTLREGAGLLLEMCRV